MEKVLSDCLHNLTLQSESSLTGLKYAIIEKDFSKKAQKKPSLLTAILSLTLLVKRPTQPKSVVVT